MTANDFHTEDELERCCLTFCTQHLILTFQYPRHLTEMLGVISQDRLTRREKPGEDVGSYCFSLSEANKSQNSKCQNNTLVSNCCTVNTATRFSFKESASLEWPKQKNIALQNLQTWTASVMPSGNKKSLRTALLTLGNQQTLHPYEIHGQPGCNKKG